MKWRLAVILFACTFARSGVRGEPERAAVWQVKSVKGTVVYFAAKDQKPLRTGLYEPKVLDELRGPKNKRFLLVEGRRCRECPSNPELFLIDPQRSVKGVRKAGWPVAGRLIHRTKSYTMREFRVYSGQCLANYRGDVVVWLGTEETKKGEESVAYLLELNYLQKGRRKMKGNIPSTQTLQAYVSAKQCRETSGRTMTTN